MFLHDRRHDFQLEGPSIFMAAETGEHEGTVYIRRSTCFMYSELICTVKRKVCITHNVETNMVCGTHLLVPICTPVVCFYSEHVAIGWYFMTH